MARNRDDLADSFDTEESPGWLTNFLADEGELDRRALWRLGSWGVASVAAITVAILASQSSSDFRREQGATADLSRQTQQIQRIASETLKETKRLSSAVDTLNSDRDRLFSLVATLEQGLESVTGSIARLPPPAMTAQSPTTPAPVPEPAPAPKVAAPQTAPPGSIGPPAPVVATAPSGIESVPAMVGPAVVSPIAIVPPALIEAVTPKTAAEKTTAVSPATLLMSARSMMAPPDPAAGKLFEPPAAPDVVPPLDPPRTVAAPPAAAEPDPAAAQAMLAVPVQRTEFGVDLGGANSIDGLRVLWQRLAKMNTTIALMRPIIVLKERANGLGMQLRLVAGPLNDAAAAARICASLAETNQACETSVFDGQRLSTGMARPPPAATRSRRRSNATAIKPEEPPEPPPPPPAPKPASLTSLLGIR